MKILITTDLYTTETNGVVTSVKNLSSELFEKGHEIRILTLSNNAHSFKRKNVYYIRSMPFSIYPDVRMPLSRHHRFLKELIDWKPDVIHTQCEFFTFTFAKYISKHTKAPIVHTYHTLYEQYVKYLVPGKHLGKFVVESVTRSKLKKVNRVIAPTHKVENALHGYGVHNDISVVPSGISLEQHQQRLTFQERSKRRRSLGIDDSKTVLINLGRLGTEKNLEELLKLFAIAITKHDNLIFLIVGDGPARKELEYKCQELGIIDSVIFTGMVKPNEVQYYYQMGDIFVSASTSETQGLTYVEAAANGLPLLCRFDLCLQNVLIQGENGYAYKNASEFLNNLDTMLKNPDWLKSAGKRSMQISEAFNTESFGDNIEDVYKTVLNKK